MQAAELLTPLPTLLTRRYLYDLLGKRWILEVSVLCAIIWYILTKPGGLYGSSYLNQEFRKFLEDKLEDETYLEDGNTTIDGIIECLIIKEFENRLKRQINLADKRRCIKQVYLRGLQKNEQKGLEENRINMGW